MIGSGPERMGDKNVKMKVQIQSGGQQGLIDRKGESHEE